MRRAGRLDQTTLLITSDHGHGLVERALYAERLLPGRTVACEGRILLVVVDGAGEARTVVGLLAEHGVYPLASEYLPGDRRSHLAAFVAPDGTAFELRPTSSSGDPDGAPGSRPIRGMNAERAISGAPKYRSSHGFRPGHPADERFAIVRGSGVPRQTRARAEAEDLAPTVAALLGVAHPGPGKSWL